MTLDDQFRFFSAAQRVGGPGRDTIVGTFGADTINGGGGDDFLFGGPVRTVAASARSGNDTINGGSGNDNIWGGDGNDVLIGGEGRDRLRGGDGFDQIFGKDGDYMAGGSGSDVYRFAGDGNVVSSFHVVPLPHGGGDHLVLRAPLLAEFGRIETTKVAGGLRVDSAVVHDGQHSVKVNFGDGTFQGESDLVVNTLAGFDPADLWPGFI